MRKIRQAAAAARACYYYGDPKPGEWEAACARALGYPDWGELNRALHLKDIELKERYARATRKLFAKFGSSPEVKGKELLEVLKRIHGGMSQEYKNASERHLGFIFRCFEARVNPAYLRETSGEWLYPYVLRH
jgi:hypothetical protein